MTQEEHILSSNSPNSGGGGGGPAAGGGGGVGSNNRSKTVKQKKFPQRGLGVAQLEKIRIEEQRKREAVQAANALAHNVIGSSDSTLPVPLPSSYSPNLNSVPPPQSPSNFPSPSPNSCLYRSSFPSVPITNGSEGPGNVNWPRLWNSEFNLEAEKQNLGFSFRSQMNSPYELNSPALPLPSVPQRSYQFQRPSSSVVNASSGISPLSSQMEPPSNQSLCGNSYISSWPDEDKMVGMKRPYPFSLESSPAPAFPGNFHPTFGASRSRSDEKPSCSSGQTAQTEPRHKYMRDDPSNSSPIPEHDNPREAIRDDERLSGDFLSLAPPAAASPPLESKHKDPLNFLGPELSDFKCLPIRENLQGQILGPYTSGEQPFSFFPVKPLGDQNAPDVRKSNREKCEKIDLNLKL